MTQTLPPLRLWLFATGLVALAGQVVLLREVLVASFGSELIYLLGIGVQMLGTAFGAAAAGRPEATTERVRALFLSFALLLPLAVAFARAERVIFRGTPGADLPFLEQLAGLAVALIPAGMLGGALFAQSARLFAAGPGTLATAYAIESAGSLAGGVLSTLLIAARAQNFTIAIVCSLIACTAALAGPPVRRRTAIAAAAAIAIVATLLGFGSRLDRLLTTLNHPRLLASGDTPYGRVTVTGSDGQIAVFINDALAYESQGTSAEEFVHLTALQPADLRAVLVLGGAVEGLMQEVQKHHPAVIRDVEIDRRQLELVRPHLHGTLQRQLETPGLIAFADPRRFLKEGAQYELILSAMPEPDSGQASRFYTREFFEECSRRLSARGVVAFRLRSSENLWSPALARRNASIVTAVRSVFRDAIVLPGAVNIVIASNTRLERDPGVLAARFEARRIDARLVSPRYIRYVLTNDRAAAVETTLAATRGEESRDARPVCYHYTLLLWLSRFFPRLAQIEASAANIWPMAATIVIAAFAITIVFRRSRWRRPLLVVFAGFAGVVLESALILAYQIREGVLYQDLGILLASFMAGLASGSEFAGRWMGRRSGIILLAGSAVTAAASAWMIASLAGGMWSCVLLLAAAGAVTGAIFAYASRGSDGRQIAPLYASDLLGGVAGSLAASLILIPLAGLTATAMLVAALSLAMLPATRSPQS